MKRWIVRIDWFVDAQPELTAESDTPVELGMTAKQSVSLLANLCRFMGKTGDKILTEDNVTWDRRVTSLCLENGIHKRVFTIDQASGLNKEEADRCASQMVDWVMAAETTDLLEA